MILNVGILALVTFERLAELWLAKRNTRRLLAMGAQEFAAGHYPLIVGLHAAWLVCLWWFALARSIQPFWLALFFLIELGRVWVLSTLAQRWTTRIIVLPDTPLVNRGPYRFADHPNYLVVIAEILVLPLVFGLWPIALIFSVLNGVLVAVRIRAEDRALGRLHDRQT
ncbi:MAG TPA: isoprenylcysteine carboxylmethyltransferase family protein [Sphingomicrobium sp.]|nr:isoprenylcysteine carboxylmethyltransferase family protein [Sphingomicrobium sp.]